ncbi:hypothetical protein BBO_02215 [Beauveria brongniartii RCEF 3172]|uniref:Uncharacterized protein n=1 Tax=Beauveria brongniartii RCEF 3172 TaxID=1081107 RepID=A0A162M1Z4_9HYPO|nr:hypothetical protein BBO_02215 [Beauveria brongniartii RCEF 3172]
MASQFSGDVEILVHVAAPSRVSDDAAYRRLAQAYLSFTPDHRARIASSPEAEPQPDDAGSVVPPSFCSDSQDMSFAGALDNRDSPHIIITGKARPTTPPRIAPPDDNATTATTVRQLLPSQVADSYPMPDCDLFNVTPTRLLQRYMGGSRQPDLAPAIQAPMSSPTLSSDGDGVGAEKNTQIEVQATAVNTSFIPASETNNSQENGKQRQTTVPVTPLVEGASRKRKAVVGSEDVHDTLALDVTHISSSDTSSASCLRRAESAPLPCSKRLRPLAPDSAATVRLVRHASETTCHPQPHPHHDTPPPLPPPLPSCSPFAYDALSQIPSTCPFSSSSLSARPPSPPVGIDRLDLSSLVSAKLAKLARDLSSRYRPLLRRRRSSSSSTTADGASLDPLERGHWRVDCRRWTPALRADAWAFLTSYIRSGLAGWGVWCRRDPDGCMLKLYGWAHVAKHTYLLLYLASGRQIKTTGAQWFDAEGKVALEIVP